MQKKKLQVLLPLLLSVAMIAGMFIGFKIKGNMPGRNFFSVEKASPLEEIVSLIRNKYVDDVDMHAIGDSAILAMLKQLDPHSAFIPAEDLQRINEDIQGSFFGIGIEYKLISDTLHVTNVLAAGPSDKAGLRIGDKLLRAGDTILSGVALKAEQIQNLLKGEMGSKVPIQLMRGSKIINTTVVRGLIPLVSIDAAYMITDTVGFIRLNRFSSQTYREFMTNLDSLKKKGMTKLILDLRDNGGGVLDEAVEIADEFLSGDKLITYTEGAHSKKKEYRARRQGQFEDGELVVLANEGTASASEILLGALQDWDRATIIGRTSFGKGLVQEQYNLSDKSALRLTIARYYTPVGRSIQRPYENGTKAYYDAVYDRRTEATNSKGDSSKLDSAHRYKTMGGKYIYSNGGINPDVYMAADSLNWSTITAQLYSKGIVADYGYQYFLQNPSIITKYKSPNTFVQNYMLKEDNWQLFEALAKKDTIDLRPVSPAERSFLQDALKLSLARQLFRTEGYFEEANRKDKTVLKALEILRN